MNMKPMAKQIMQRMPPKRASRYLVRQEGGIFVVLDTKLQHQNVGDDGRIGPYRTRKMARDAVTEFVREDNKLTIARSSAQMRIANTRKLKDAVIVQMRTALEILIIAEFGGNYAKHPQLKGMWLNAYKAVKAADEAL